MCVAQRGVVQVTGAVLHFCESLPRRWVSGAPPSSLVLLLTRGGCPWLAACALSLVPHGCP